MKLRLVLLIAVMTLCSHSAMAASLQVDIYTGHTLVGGGAPFSDKVASFTSADILFATSTGYAWHPLGLTDFGAEITGFLNVASDGIYPFALNSDDGSMLFINGSLVVDNGGGHGAQTVPNSITLTAGQYPFTVQFFEAYGGPSGVDLYLPQGVVYSDNPEVPEPSTLLLFGCGIAGLIGFGLRKKK